MASLRLVGLVLALVLAGCAGDDDDDDSTTGASAASERCMAATSDLMTPLGNSMTDDAHRVRNGQVVQSADDDALYFVSAEIYGAEVEDGTIGTWATTSTGGGEAIWTVDDVSAEYSDLRDGTEVAGLAMEDDGAEESRACVEAAL